jgi:glycerol-3-phosphate cytidylyltransferase
VVFLQTDPTVERPEKLKPIFSTKERKDLLESIKFIDRVITYTYERELYELIENGSFDLRFLGDDYKNKSYTADDLGIEVYYLDRSHGWSATKYKELIAASLRK